jgi:hypothetical protein
MNDIYRFLKLIGGKEESPSKFFKMTHPNFSTNITQKFHLILKIIVQVQGIKKRQN